MKYRLLMSTEKAKQEMNQEFEAESDEDAIGEVHDMMEATGIPVKAITRIGQNGEETIIKTFR